MENLPGYPDNIRHSSSGGYWVALTAIRQSNLPTPIWETLGPYPFVRDLMYKWDYVKSLVCIMKMIKFTNVHVELNYKIVLLCK
jgi:hypothetical protein